MTISEISSYSWIISIASSISFVIIGWGVVYFNARKIATRAETKSIVDRAISQVEDITQFATEYWLSGRKSRLDDDQYLMLLMAKITRLSCTVDILSSRGLIFSFEYIALLSEKSSLGCENANVMQKIDCHQRGFEINECGVEITNHLIECYHMKYQPVG